MAVIVHKREVVFNAFLGCELGNECNKKKLPDGVHNGFVVNKE